MAKLDTEIKEQLKCYHCGEDCERKDLIKEDHHFCCDGCKTVYELLSENNLYNYYDINASPGASFKNTKAEQFAYLDDAQVKQKLIRFTYGTQTSVTLYIPRVHCSSCIWLLENLYKLHPGISKTQVNFLRREVSIHYPRREDQPARGGGAAGAYRLHTDHQPQRPR